MNNIDSLDNKTPYLGTTSTQGRGNAVASSFESTLQLAKAGGSVKFDPVRELQEWAAMTPDQQMFYMVLHSLGVSKEQFDQMSAEDKQKLVEKVREQIQEMAKSGTSKPTAMG